MSPPSVAQLVRKFPVIPMKPSKTRQTPTLRLSVLALLALNSCSPAPSGEAADTQVLEAEASEIARRFVATLLPTLQQAMQGGGPVTAIEVCSVQAPAMAAALSEETGWQVRRVSLKPRNRSLASPDTWETAKLREFDQRRQAGEPGPMISSADIVDGQYRYMQAQLVMPLCLSCHGSELSTAVVSALQEYYPGDLATGYSLGQIRGAISLWKPLD